MTKTIAEHLAAEAKALTFRGLPPEVVHQVKRSVLDALGIAFGGYLSEPSRVIQNLIKKMGGPADSTVFGSGLKTSCLYATLANGAMVRYLDYMDRTFLTKEARNNTGHHGESISPILAVGEWQHSTGKEVITAIVLAYEFFNKMADSVGGGLPNIIEKRGWAGETIRVPCTMALVAGKLLGLNVEQMANGLGFIGCFSMSLGLVKGGSGHEALTMARNIKFAYHAHNGILAALLAQQGFKGPLNVFEGHHAINDQVVGGKMDFEKLRRPRKDWTILNTWIKNFAAGGLMQGHIEATISLVKEHDIRAEDVAKVKINTTSLLHGLLGSPEVHRYPDTKYTADHSCYYVTAVAILDRAVGPEQYTNKKLRDPRVRTLEGKIFVDRDPKLDALASPGSGPAIVEITTKNGKKYTCQVLRPKGHPLNPMTDADVEGKFRSMAGKFIDEKRMRQIISTVYNLEKLDDVGKLIKLLVIPKKVS